MPQIFIWKNPPDLEAGERHFMVYATAQDGTMVLSNEVSSLIYARQQMGLIGKHNHNRYEHHYPEGYELVDLLELNEDQLDIHPEFNVALNNWDKAIIARGEV